MKRVIPFVFVFALWAAAVPTAVGQDAVVDDPRTVEQLIEKLGDELPLTRLEAAKALGAKGAEAMPAIFATLEDVDWRVRRGGVDALAAMPERDGKVAQRLILLLDDPNAWVRDGAAELLGKFGKDAEAAAEGLARLCADKEPWVRYSAINSLQSVTKDKDILLPAAVALIRMPDTCWRSRGTAVGLIGKHGKDYDPGKAALFHVMEHPSEGMWCSVPKVVEVLLKQGVPCETVEKAILKFGRRDEWSNRRLAMSLLVKHMGDSESTLPFVRDLAENDPHRKVRAAAAGTLEQLEKKSSQP